MCLLTRSSRSVIIVAFGVTRSAEEYKHTGRAATNSQAKIPLWRDTKSHRRTHTLNCVWISPTLWYKCQLKTYGLSESWQGSNKTLQAEFGVNRHKSKFLLRLKKKKKNSNKVQKSFTSKRFSWFRNKGFRSIQWSWTEQMCVCVRERVNGTWRRPHWMTNWSTCRLTHRQLYFVYRGPA